MNPPDHRSDTDARVQEAARGARAEGGVAMLAALGLLVLNGLVSRWQGWTFPGAEWWAWFLLAVPEVLLLVMLVLSALRSVRPGRHRNVALLLLGFLAVSALTATGLLMFALATADITAGQLLLNALVVWGTNLIVFGLIFWELDGGGPVKRVMYGRRTPDFQFPQDQFPALAPKGWRPRLLDYEYVSLTNSLALSPTDAMPLSRRAKSLMALESLISNAVIVLVIARAVNILGA